jgi:GNAT superfamily N-acetyltransferase
MGAAAPDAVPFEAMAAAVEADLVAHVSLLRGPPIGEVRRDADATWFISGKASHDNGVLRAILPDRNLDRAVKRILAPFEARSLPMMWWMFTTPDGPDPAVDRALRGEGLSLESDLPGMALDLAVFHAPAPPAAVSIHRVRDESLFREWAGVVGAAFDSPGFADEPSAAGFLAQGFGDDSPFRHYICRLEGTPVGASTLSVGAGVAGLANIGTVPGRRGRGIGSAVAAAALLDGRELGLRIGALSADRLGFRVYEKLGFRTVCRHLTYVRPAGGRS